METEEDDAELDDFLYQYYLSRHQLMECIVAAPIYLSIFTFPKRILASEPDIINLKENPKEKSTGDSVEMFPDLVKLHKNFEEYNLKRFKAMIKTHHQFASSRLESDVWSQFLSAKFNVTQKAFSKIDQLYNHEEPWEGTYQN